MQKLRVKALWLFAGGVWMHFEFFLLPLALVIVQDASLVEFGLWWTVATTCIAIIGADVVTAFAVFSPYMKKREENLQMLIKDGRRMMLFGNPVGWTYFLTFRIIGRGVLEPLWFIVGHALRNLRGRL